MITAERTRAQEERLNFADDDMAWRMPPEVRGLLLGLVLLLPLAGCHKKTQAVVLPQSQAPVALATPPAPASAPMVEAPSVNVPPVPTAAAASKPQRQKKKPPVKSNSPATTAPSSTAPTQVAAAEGLAEGSAIGALTAGGDTSPQTRQDAIDLIASNERRLKALPADTVKAQRTQISKIRNFQRQAQEALDSGDAEGAKTLATKAGLLLYDLDRGGQT